MPSAPYVMTDATGNAPPAGTLFKGMRFFLVQRLPLRSTFVQHVKSNGGEIVMLEKSADIVIADHVRRDGPPGSYSYTFIENSIANGALEDREDHIAFPTTQEPRAVGDRSRPPKQGSRTAFTKEDDDFLYKWVTEHKAQGGYALGNEMYIQLERVNNRHPYQAWLHRWKKYVSLRSPPIQAQTPTTPGRPSIEVQRPPRTASAATKRKRTPSPVAPVYTKRNRTSTPEESQALPPLGSFAQKLLKAGKEAALKAERMKDISLSQVQGQKIPKEPVIVAPNPSATSPTTFAEPKSIPDSIPSETLPRSTAEPHSPTTARHVHSATLQSPPLRSPNLEDHPRQPMTPKQISNLATSDTGNASDSLTSLAQTSKGPGIPSRRSFTPVQGQRLSSTGMQDGMDLEELKFSERDIVFLKKEAHHIQNITVGRYKKAWDDLAITHPRHTAMQWRAYYETNVLPWYEEQEIEKVRAQVRIKDEPVEGPIVKSEEPGILDALEDALESNVSVPASVETSLLEPEVLHVLEAASPIGNHRDVERASVVSEGLYSLPEHLIQRASIAGKNEIVAMEDSILTEIVQEESSTNGLMSRTKTSETTLRITSPSNTAPSNNGVLSKPSPERRQILGTFMRPQFLDLTISSSEEAQISSSAPIADKIVKEDHSGDGNGDSNEYAHVPGHVGASKRIKAERDSHESPIYSDKWAQAIAERRSRLSGGNAKSPTMSRKVEIINLLSDDEDEVLVAPPTASMHLERACFVPEVVAHEVSVQVESERQVREPSFTAIDEDIVEETTEMKIDQGPDHDHYGPEDQLLAESNNADNPNSILNDGATSNLDENIDMMDTRDGLDSTDEASEQLQVEVNAAISVYEDNTVHEDDKENHGVVDEDGSHVNPGFAKMQENPTSPFQAFTDDPQDFHLVPHAGGWTEIVDMPDKDDLPAKRKLEADVDNRMIDIESLETGNEVFGSAQEQLVASVDLDDRDHNEDAEDDEVASVDGSAPAMIVTDIAIPTPNLNPSPKRSLLSPFSRHSEDSIDGEDDDDDDDDEAIPAARIDAYTQDILNAETQVPDLDMASPPPDPDLDMPSPPPTPKPQRSPAHKTNGLRTRIESSPLLDIDMLSPAQIHQQQPSRHSSSHRRKTTRPRYISPTPLPKHVRSSPPIPTTSSRTRARATPTSAQHHPRQPPAPSPSASASIPTQPSPADIEAFFATNRSRGYAPDDIALALRSTTLDLRLACVVLDALGRTGALPWKVRGVWAAEEDAVLNGGDAEAMARLEWWHGKARFNARLDALHVWANQEDDDQEEPS